MSVAKLITQNFRNLDGVAINFHPKLNFIVGDNGSRDSDQHDGGCASQIGKKSR